MLEEIRWQDLKRLCAVFEEAGDQVARPVTAGDQAARLEAACAVTEEDDWSAAPEALSTSKARF